MSDDRASLVPGTRAGRTQGDYAALAEFWTCFFGDRGPEVEAWATLARPYGRRVLAPMAAVGELAHGLARAGFEVVAVDRSAAMVREGRRRFPPDEALTWMRGDVRRLRRADMPFDFAFLANGDLHHFDGFEAQARVLASVAGALRPGGAVGLELFAPAGASWATPPRRFEPLRPPPGGARIWKDGATRFDAATLRLEIEQTLHVQRAGQRERHPHRLTLQLLERDALPALLERAGLRWLAEYGGYDLAPWAPGAATWIVLAEKA